VKDRQEILTSKTIAQALKKVYDNLKCLLVWSEKFLTDRGPEFRGDCKKLMREHDVKIQKAFTKNTMSITKKFNGDLTRKLFHSQDASNLLTLHLNKIFWVW
ncbi:7885_t:CDS:1, partial [Funneliformis caledonium]